MKSKRLILLNTFFLLVLLAACAPDGFTTPTPAEPLLTITGIMQDYADYKDQLIRVRGYGIIEAMMPLCPGHVGMDTRMAFVDEVRDNITARLAGNIYEQAAEHDILRDFLGYVRIFSGEMGCPGSVRTETFPYFEIVAIKGSMPVP